MTGYTNHIAALATAGLASLLVVAYRDYCAFLALGTSGVSSNVWGYCKQLSWTSVARRDTTTPAPFETEKARPSAGPNATTSYLTKALAPRSGPRPTVPHFVAPQRQVTATASAEMTQRMAAYLEGLVERNPSCLQLGLSFLEGPVPAVQVNKAVELPHYLRRTRGEIIHVHPSDGSTHLILSLADATSVILQEWGQRHRLSGSVIGWGYVMIYAPRDQVELEIWKDIVCAAARYCCAEFAGFEAPIAAA